MPPSPFVAPERLQPTDVNTSSSDVFSCGVVLFILTVGTAPFKTASRSDVHYRLFLDNNEAFWKLFESRGLSAELVDLLNNLLTSVPAHRLSFEAIQSHPWSHE